jgi:hypothetical protein
MTNVQKAYDRVYRNEEFAGNVIPQTLGVYHPDHTAEKNRIGLEDIEKAFLYDNVQFGVSFTTDEAVSDKFRHQHPSFALQYQGRLRIFAFNVGDPITKSWV